MKKSAVYFFIKTFHTKEKAQNLLQGKDFVLQFSHIT